MPSSQAHRLKRYAVAASLLVVSIGWFTFGGRGDRTPLAPPPSELSSVSTRSLSRGASSATPIRLLPHRPGAVSLCQALGPAAPHPIWAVDSAAGCGYGEVGWASRGYTNWQSYAQGEYVGNARLAHVPEYRLRVDDQISVFYLRTREIQSRDYELQVGDTIRVESLTAGASGPALSATGGDQSSEGPDDGINRELIIQPDGTITLPLVNRVTAAGRTLSALQGDLEERFGEFINTPAITVTPLVVNTKLEDLLETVDARGGLAGGLQIPVVVTPAGKIQLPGLGSVYVQGLTLAEAKQEIDARYGQSIPGVSVTVDLTQRAQRFVYVLGEVPAPGRFELQGPTTVMQAIALAEGWNVGANLRQVVVFRRGPDWRLLATMVDLRGALYARRPTPADEIWLNDSDIVLVPKSPIQMVDEVIEQFFTRGAYAAVPIEIFWGQGFSSISALTSAN
ncbi:MAG: polysaccharide biosynthesis/export family protein [Planctomycetota bacterium]